MKIAPTLHRFIFIIPDGMSCEFRVDPARIAKLKPKVRERCINSFWERMGEFEKLIPPDICREWFFRWKVDVHYFATTGTLV